MSELTQTGTTLTALRAFTGMAPRGEGGPATSETPREVGGAGTAGTHTVELALDREAALRRAEHSTSVERLRRALFIGALVWPSQAVLAWWIARFGGEGNLRALWILDATGWLAILAALWWLRRPVEPSRRALWLLDVSICTFCSVLVGLMCVWFRGIASPYATGVNLIPASASRRRRRCWKSCSGSRQSDREPMPLRVAPPASRGRQFLPACNHEEKR